MSLNPDREQRYRDKLQLDGWRWLRRAIGNWLWHEKHGAAKRARQANRYRLHAGQEKALARLNYYANREQRLTTMAAYRERNRANIRAADRDAYAAKKETP